MSKIVIVQSADSELSGPPVGTDFKLALLATCFDQEVLVAADRANPLHGQLPQMDRNRVLSSDWGLERCCVLLCSLLVARTPGLTGEDQHLGTAHLPSHCCPIRPDLSEHRKLGGADIYIPWACPGAQSIVGS